MIVVFSVFSFRKSFDLRNNNLYLMLFYLTLYTVDDEGDDDVVSGVSMVDACRLWVQRTQALL